MASKYPTDVIATAQAVYAVARRVLAAEAAEGGVYPSDALAPPPVEATPALARVIASAGLDELETLVFRVLVAAEVDRGVHRVLRRLASVDALSGTPVDGLITAVEGLGANPVEVLRTLRPDQALAIHGLVEILDEHVQPIVQRVMIPARVIDFVVSGVAPRPAPPLALEPVKPVEALCPLPARDVAEDAAPLLRRLFPMIDGLGPIWIVGPKSSGRRTLVAAVAAEHGKRLLCAASSDLAALPPRAMLTSLRRELVLQDAVICVHDVESAPDHDPASGEGAGRPHEPRGAAVTDLLARAGLPLVVVTTQIPPTTSFDYPVHVVKLGRVRPDDALRLWQRDLPDVEALAGIASRFRLPPGRIVRTVEAAQALAAGQARPVRVEDVTRAISDGVSQQVSILGSRIEDNQTWDDIVLHADTLESVCELLARVKHRRQVLDEWGFRDKLAKGLGLAALFHGPPGTGKTMIASLIARELHQDLYQVDLSRIVSKWIGETEKNLSRVFDAAEGANVMLLFDEADSLFSKRTEVKSSTDRYANAEVNYLLQRVERFEGVCILTTNLETSIDTAFKRRLAFRIEFPMPDERERSALWQRIIPTNAKIAGVVDHAKLARDYEISGGNIRNAVLRAAYLAADQGGAITMQLLERAVKLEYRDAGKLGTNGAIYTR